MLSPVNLSILVRILPMPEAFEVFLCVFADGLAQSLFGLQLFLGVDLGLGFGGGHGVYSCIMGYSMEL
jgi:hypothetical protein